MWELIQRHWERAGVSPNPGAPARAFDDFERDYGVRVPAEVREFYAHADGMPSGASDGELLSFYPLAGVYPVPVVLPTGHRGLPDYNGIEHALPDAASYFVFADYSMRCHVYAVRLSADPAAACPVVWIAGGDKWEVQAASFGEFLRLYAEDPGQVLFPDAKPAEPGAADVTLNVKPRLP